MGSKVRNNLTVHEHHTPEHGDEAEAPLVPETKTDGVEGERNSCTFTTLAFPLGRAAPEASPETPVPTV